ncbi:histidine phosphatase family protein [Polynucleobacter sp. UK-Mo-2m-Kol15]|uniref:histidine phosphatase family protein n=1 Tax=Polynucleobacter sp. UK-Mo-2m-Kol15 TaxID=2576916 RepID=UPI001C0AAA6C|nr:histidine phosphatase family protein [Polynucleobacter sp. UK-Mo-2m-Kol15]MBU3574781.1 histidine phosphatase family protein [Polynucleobacter sp. UK-Mo-2m-Kol15]
MDLFLIRHGQSLANAAGRLIADRYDGLSALGISQSQELAHTLAEMRHMPSLIFSSPWARARETAEYVYSQSIEINFDARLAETNPGKFGTWLEADFNQQFPEFNKNIANQYEEGESHLDMAYRVCNWVDEEVFPRTSESGLISVVAHGGPISVILQYLLGIPIETRYPSFSVPNASFSILKWRPDLNRYCLLSAGHQ